MLKKTNQFSLNVEIENLKFSVILINFFQYLWLLMPVYTFLISSNIFTNFFLRFTKRSATKSYINSDKNLSFYKFSK